MKSICLLGILAYNSFWDVRTREIPLFLNILAALAGVCRNICAQELTAEQLAGGMLLGAGLILMGILTREAVGIGDGLLLLVTGSFLGGRENLLLFVTALFLAGGAAAVLLVSKKAGRKTAIPFAPFLLTAYVGRLLL